MQDVHEVAEAPHVLHGELHVSELQVLPVRENPVIQLVQVVLVPEHVEHGEVHPQVPFSRTLPA